MLATLQRLEQLLVRYEIDTAVRLHDIDYQATIALLCDTFQEQMTALMLEPQQLQQCKNPPNA
jgi:hypothetical protein